MSRVSYIFLAAVFIFFGCEKKITDEQFEQNVFAEIFLKVVDSTYKDQRLYTSFPAPKEDIYDQNGKLTKRDSKIETLKRDTLSLIIAVGNRGLINEQTNLQDYNTRKFIFKHLSELPRTFDFENWTAKYSKFAGAMFFSSIKFDAGKKHGTLNVSYHCGSRCGLGYVVTIEDINDKWVISKVENTWIL